MLINLTGGVVLRLNPTIVNDRENVFYYLNRAFEKRIMIAIAGAELIFVNVFDYYLRCSYKHVIIFLIIRLIMARQERGLEKIQILSQIIVMDTHTHLLILFMHNKQKNITSNCVIASKI